MRRFIGRFLIFTVPILALLALQLYADPLDIYPWQFLPELVRNPTKDKICNYLNDTGRNYDTIVLGSSRAMQLRIPGNSYNFAVHNAMTEDFYCILNFILENNQVPLKRVIVGVDIESFNNNQSVNIQLINEMTLIQYLDDLSLEDTVFRKDTLNTLGRSFLRTFDSIRNTLEGIQLPEYLDHRTGQYSVHLPEYNLVNISPNFAKAYQTRFNEYDTLDSERISYFDDFLELCEQRNIEVIGFITCIHPQLEYLLQNQGFYSERKTEIIKYLNNIEYDMFYFYDFSTPDEFDGDNTDFRDPAHVGEYNAALISDILITPHRQRCDEY